MAFLKKKAAIAMLKIATHIPRPNNLIIPYGQNTQPSHK
jgi:hypothetical protein